LIDTVSLPPAVTHLFCFLSFFPIVSVTDDFVPFIKERLEEMRKKHNIVLVTNDHVEVLTDMSDNTVTVSAIDRSVVKINDREGVDRTKAIHALGVGNNYHRKARKEEYYWFYDVEVRGNAALMQIVYFNTFCFGLFLATFWDSASDSAALVLVAGGVSSSLFLCDYMFCFHRPVPYSYTP
jgi:hypothetical protein